MIDSNVTLVDCMGTDNSVADAARVSLDKVASLFTLEENTKLIRYLAKHRHWSPFAHCTLSFRISAPIFVARQLAKHQVGFAWNEVSRRYVDFVPQVWKPITWRARAKSIKQGSLLTPVSNEDKCTVLYQKSIAQAVDSYSKLLEAGVCPEQARAVLPLGTMTQWIWTGSLYGFSRVCGLRLAPDTQEETRNVANHINQICFENFPIAWEALNGTA